MMVWNRMISAEDEGVIAGNFQAQQILKLLSNHLSMRASELATAIGEHKEDSTFHETLAELVADGFVTRKEDPILREELYGPTPRGFAVLRTL